MGQTAYFGPAQDSLGHFSRLGHEPVGLVNPADYLLEVLPSTFQLRRRRFRAYYIMPLAGAGHPRSMYSGCTT